MDNKLRRLLIIAVILFVGMWAFSGYAIQSAKDLKEKYPNGLPENDTVQVDTSDPAEVPIIEDRPIETEKKETIVLLNGDKWSCNKPIQELTETSIPKECKKL